MPRARDPAIGSQFLAGTRCPTSATSVAPPDRCTEPCYRRSPSSPDCRGGLHQHIQLAPLLVCTRKLRIVLRIEPAMPKTALRTDRQLIERHKSRGFVDALFQLVRSLDPTGLCSNDAEDYNAVLWHEAQWREIAFAQLVVVLQQ